MAEETNPVGGHLIEGVWTTGSEEDFLSEPVIGTARRFCSATQSDVDAAVQAAERDFGVYAATSALRRSSFLEGIARLIREHRDTIREVVASETGLPHARLDAELDRTVVQLRLFAQHILKPDWQERRHDPAVPNRMPACPDLLLIQRPVGPVAVFSASNFPLAFSVAGGDTASALAAGCPVIVKAHQAHPGTSELIATLVDKARCIEGLPPGVFALLQSSQRSTGTALVTHPSIQAVGFTGSTIGGRAMFNLCAGRETPIPFYGELGAINPLFVLRGAGMLRAEKIAQDWVASITQGAGQFCTKPGLVILPEGEIAERFVMAATAAMRQCPEQCMLSTGMADGFRASTSRIEATAVMQPCVDLRTLQGRDMGPVLMRTTADHFLSVPELTEEAFGPFGLAVTVADHHQSLGIARAIPGQLTATLHCDSEDHAEAASLLRVLERKAGRLVWNGFPTGVAVSDAMVHGGPYPASTNFGHTSVGTMSIRRWLRPVCYQDVPRQILDQFCPN
jgi:NADP-dependent aldehyde dehydrogenase